MRGFVTLLVQNKKNSHSPFFMVLYFYSFQTLIFHSWSYNNLWVYRVYSGPGRGHIKFSRMDCKDIIRPTLMSQFASCKYNSSWNNFKCICKFFNKYKYRSSMKLWGALLTAEQWWQDWFDWLVTYASQVTEVISLLHEKGIFVVSPLLKG